MIFQLLMTCAEMREVRNYSRYGQRKELKVLLGSHEHVKNTLKTLQPLELNCFHLYFAQHPKRASHPASSFPQAFPDKGSKKGSQSFSSTVTRLMKNE
jgi:hypothetical protein